MKVFLSFVFICFFFTFIYSNNITDYKSYVSTIFNSALNEDIGYNRLGEMCNTFGSRLSGSTSLEDAIDWTVLKLNEDGFDNVFTEEVSVPTWVRGFREKLTMTYPRNKPMDILSLGGSIGTPFSGISGQVLVVNSFEDLVLNSTNAQGKIVVFNAPFVSYGTTVSYRTSGAVEAAKAGAIASLTRSVTPFSLYTPHTGVMYYEDGIPQIPSAAITVEDAILLQNIQDSGVVPEVELFMNCETLANSQSRNVIAELTGSVLPNEFILISGHIDSWDVGTGAHDDAGGILQTWEAMRLLASLDMRPRRTIRLVFFTNEENGGAGADTYFADYIDQLGNNTFCFESDSGTFTPVGFSVSGTAGAIAEVAEIANLMSDYVQLNVFQGGAGADVSPLTNAGVPGVGLDVAADGVGEDTYFWYHHTRADTFDHIDKHEFQLCVGTVATLAYVIADMETNLPRSPI